MNITNRRHKSDESVNETKKKVSKTGKFEKLREIFRKQWSAAKEIKTWSGKNYALF